MSMIFDGFATLGKAQEFMAQVKKRFNLECELYTNQEDSDDADPFPCRLEGFIVHVPRTDVKTERRVERLVESYGGTFAGT